MNNAYSGNCFVTLTHINESFKTPSEFCHFSLCFHSNCHHCSVQEVFYLFIYLFCLAVLKLSLNFSVLLRSPKEMRINPKSLSRNSKPKRQTGRTDISVSYFVFFCSFFIRYGEHALKGEISSCRKRQSVHFRWREITNTV